MIKFFRHIRKSLIERNQMRKYFKYAIGEILLVVIGILIALQINTWNEGRKLKNSEYKVLGQLRSDLNTNLEEIKGIRRFMQGQVARGEKLLSFLDGKEYPMDSVKIWVSYSQSKVIFNNANTTYKNLQSLNEQVLSNDSLRLFISLMYERNFVNITSRENYEAEYRLPPYKRELMRLFKVGDASFYNPNAQNNLFYETVRLRINTPRDIEELRRDVSFKNYLVDLHNYRKLRAFRLKNTIKELTELINEIDNEIK